MDREELKEKIDQLPREYSMVLSQVLIEELSYAEIAETMGSTEEKVKQLFNKAIVLLSH